MPAPEHQEKERNGLFIFKPLDSGDKQQDRENSPHIQENLFHHDILNPHLSSFPRLPDHIIRNRHIRHKDEGICRRNDHALDQEHRVGQLKQYEQD